MKLTDIANIFRSIVPEAQALPISETAEFELMPIEEQKKIVKLGFPRYTPAELFEMFNDRPTIEGKVKLNTGETHQVKLVYGRYGLVSPAEDQFEQELFQKDTRYYMLNSVRSPKSRSAKYFTDKALAESSEYQELSAKYFTYLKRATERFKSDALQKLKATLSPAAQQALADNLHLLIKEKQITELYEWFKNENFQDIPTLAELSTITSLSAWFYPAGAKNVQISIDWKNRIFKKN